MCPLVYSRSPVFGDLKVGGEAPFYTAPQKISRLCWRGLVSIGDPGELGMALKFQSPSVRVARLRVPQKVESHSQVDSVIPPPRGPG